MSEENKNIPENEDIAQKAETAMNAESENEQPKTSVEAEKERDKTGENSELDKAKEEIKTLQAQVAESKDRYVRLMAEFDNFRRRTAK